MSSWECFDISKDEWLGQVSIDYQNSIPKLRFFDAMSKIREIVGYTFGPGDMSQSLRLSQIFIAEYRSRELTKLEDRIMAFAGTARATHSLTNLTYFAGLWVDYLPLCLLWKVAHPAKSSLRGIIAESSKSTQPKEQRIHGHGFRFLPVLPNSLSSIQSSYSGISATVPCPCSARRVTRH